LDDSEAIARAHVAAWKAAYRGVFPEEYLNDLTAEDRLPWWRERLASYENVGHHILVVEDDGQVVGFASGGPSDGDDPRAAELWQLYLDPKAWGRGLGAAVFDELVSRLRSDGFASAVLWVAPENRRARRLYEGRGWVDAGVQKTESLWGIEVAAVKYRYVFDI
jgi:ribosomal protein S18 acetylase RimI-like enzyme